MYANNWSDTDTNQGLGSTGEAWEWELAGEHEQQTTMDGEQWTLNGGWGAQTPQMDAGDNKWQQQWEWH